MPELKLNPKHQNTLNDFSVSLQKIYRENLLSIVLYGSASSGEFVKDQSNLNILVVLKDAGLGRLKLATTVINEWRFRFIHPLFLSEEYIRASLDVFPIEFLDMQENYMVLTGKDVLKDLFVDTKYLRFQCEHELKAKIISLRQVYLRQVRNKAAMEGVLFKSFISVAHILRNIIRLKVKAPSYLKEDLLKDIALEFSINVVVWEKILAARNKEIKLGYADVEAFFLNFVQDLEKIAEIVDRF